MRRGAIKLKPNKKNLPAELRCLSAEGLYFFGEVFTFKKLLWKEGNCTAGELFEKNVFVLFVSRLFHLRATQHARDVSLHARQLAALSSHELHLFHHLPSRGKTARGANFFPKLQIEGAIVVFCAAHDARHDHARARLFGSVFHRKSRLPSIASFRSAKDRKKCLQHNPYFELKRADQISPRNDFVITSAFECTCSF